MIQRTAKVEGEADEEGCGGPREACMVPGCKECGMPAPSMPDADAALIAGAREAYADRDRAGEALALSVGVPMDDLDDALDVALRECCEKVPALCDLAERQAKEIKRLTHRVALMLGLGGTLEEMTRWRDEALAMVREFESDKGQLAEILAATQRDLAAAKAEIERLRQLVVDVDTGNAGAAS